MLWKRSVWLGQSEINDTHFVYVENTGVVTGRTTHRLPGAPSGHEKLLGMKGVPWNECTAHFERREEEQPLEEDC